MTAPKARSLGLIRNRARQFEADSNLLPFRLIRADWQSTLCIRLKEELMGVVKGSISKQQRELSGWLVGHFLPKDSPFRDDNVEIYLKSFPCGPVNEKLHMHPYGKEYLIVIQGKARILIGDGEILISSGEYLSMENRMKDKLIEVLEPLVIVGVRYPSVPNNKVFLE